MHGSARPAGIFPQIEVTWKTADFVNCAVYCTIHCTVHYTVHCTEHCTVRYTVHYTLYCTVHCTEYYSVQFTVPSMYTILYTVNMTIMYNLHCALYTEHCVLQARLVCENFINPSPNISTCFDSISSLFILN